MAKAHNKTVATTGNVNDFLASLDDEQQRKDSEVLIRIMQDVTGAPPVMWGASIVGFGEVKLTYPSGRELDWLRIGFSPRKGKLSLYLTFDASRYANKLDALGKYKTGKGCIYINKLADVDVDKLADLIKFAYSKGRGAYS